MKTIKLEDGTSVQISDESYNELKRAVDKNWEVKRDGDAFYCPNQQGEKTALEAKNTIGEKLKQFEFLNSKDYDKGALFCRMLNWKRRNDNEPLGDEWYEPYLRGDYLFVSYNESKKTFPIQFSTEQACYSFIYAFGEEALINFIKWDR